jgi:hypothetical protein
MKLTFIRLYIRTGNPGTNVAEIKRIANVLSADIRVLRGRENLVTRPAITFSLAKKQIGPSSVAIDGMMAPYVSVPVGTPSTVREIKPTNHSM